MSNTSEAYEDQHEDQAEDKGKKKIWVKTFYFYLSYTICKHKTLALSR